MPCTVLTRRQIYCEADADICLSRRILRDVADRGRTVEGVIKQWFMWVKPNFEKVSSTPDPMTVEDLLTHQAVCRSAKEERRLVQLLLHLKTPS